MLRKIIMYGLFSLLMRSMSKRMGGMGGLGGIRLVVYSAVMAFAMSIWSYYGGLQAYLMIGSVIFFMLLFSEIMMDHVKVSIESVGLCTLGGYLIPLLLSSLIRILGGENGRYFILLPFTIAFLSDAG